MKNAFIAAVLIAVLLIGGLPLRSAEVFNTGPFACTGEKQVQTALWKNDGGIKLVRKGQLWMGMYTGSVADLGFAVRNERDGTTLFRGNWDHYAEPAGINDQIVNMDFAPDYILLKPGDTLTLYYHCQSLGERMDTGHIIVNLWFP
jgi:hypothetical protein